MWTVPVMWFSVFVAIIALISSVIWKCRLIYKENEEKAKKNSNKAKHTHNRIARNITIEIIDIVIELLLIIVGAVLAIVFTNYRTGQQDIEKLTDHLNLVYEDFVDQENCLEKIIGAFDGNHEDVSDLIINAAVDTALFTEVIHTDLAMELIPKAPYSMMLNNCRTIDHYYAMLQNPNLSSSNVPDLVNGMQRHLEYLTVELELTIQYINEEITKEQCEEALTEHLNIIKAEASNIIWAE